MNLKTEKLKRLGGLGLGLYVLQAAFGLAYGIYVGVQQGMGF